MNLNLELEEIIRESIEENFGEAKDDLATFVYRDISNWMNRNYVVLYQP